MSTGADRAEVQDCDQARRGVLEPGLRVLAMLSGGADSVCLVHALLDLIGATALTALHVQPRPQAWPRRTTSGSAPSSAIRLGVRARGRARPDRGRGGMWRRSRARPATAPRSGARGSRARPDRDRPHGERPGRDRSSTGSSPHPAAGRSSGCSRDGAVIRAAAAGDGRADARLLRARRARLAGGRVEPRPGLRAKPPEARRPAAAPGDPSGGGRERARHRRGARRRVGSARAAPSTMRSRRPAPAGSLPWSRPRGSRELPPALRRPRPAPAGGGGCRGPAPARTGRVEEIERLAAARWHGCARPRRRRAGVSEYGLLRFRPRGTAPSPGAGGDGGPRTLPVRRLGGCLRPWRNRQSRSAPAIAARSTSRSSTPAARGADAHGPQLGARAIACARSVSTARNRSRTSSRSQGPAVAAPPLPVVESGGEIAWVAGVAVSERFN